MVIVAIVMMKHIAPTHIQKPIAMMSGGESIAFLKQDVPAHVPDRRHQKKNMMFSIVMI